MSNNRKNTRGSNKAFRGPGAVNHLAKQIQKDFKLTWTAALLRAKADMGVSLLSITFTEDPTGLSVVFDSTVVLNGATVASYFWDFGDGNDDTIADPTNVFGGAATYKVRVTVTDTTGATSVATKSLVVTA